MHPPRHTLARYCLLLLYLLGLFFSGFLAYLHFQEDAGRFCELFASDCLGAITSEYGELAGFPVSTMALGYFALQFLSIARQRHPPIMLIRAGNFLALLASAWFLYVMRYILQEACPACYGVHAVNLTAFLLSLALVPEKSSLFASRHGYSSASFAAPALVALLVFSAANLAIARHQLAEELRKTRENISYLKYMHLRSQEHQFIAEPGDEVIGKPDLAQHQIVLIYKDGCSHCERAREELRRNVKEFPTAVYLLMKDYRRMTRERLDELEIRRTPAVFIDGRRAEGWDAPGFMKQYTEDCGC